MVVGTQQMDVPMVLRMQRTGDRLMVACTQYLSDNLILELYTPFNEKTDGTGIRPMAAGTQHADSGPRAKTNPYLKQAWQMGKCMIVTSQQQIYSGLMAVSQ